MLITQTQGFPTYEPTSDDELHLWRPAPCEVFQFVKLSRREYWIFHCGAFLGLASRLTYADAWRASSDALGICVAPLDSLLECAERLMVASR
ncbi:hypothetical protein B1R32_106110 [Abditibacterium utsteinense]|uniref:Uncharacterized protein n=1 Tax=Abditibacterium utsteinense TaxID=1960156 RepID=A0A2S8STY4_9BACT|nr:hypothetical protein [Abditibacterium utsteinense]PQV64264.1 hypothetical protein B1R32_106110 [Abditibacterium utsteinense]